MGSQPLSSAPPPQQAVPPPAARLAASLYFCFTASWILGSFIGLAPQDKSVQIVASKVLRLGRQSVVTCSFGDLDDGIRGHGAAARAAFFVEKVHDLPQGVGISRVPEKSAFAAHLDETNLF